MGGAIGKLFFSLGALLLWPLFSRAGLGLIALIALPFTVGRIVVVNLGITSTASPDAIWATRAAWLTAALMVGWALYRPAANSWKVALLGGARLALRYLLVFAIVIAAGSFFANGLKLEMLARSALTALLILPPLLGCRMIDWWLARDSLRHEGG